MKESYTYSIVPETIITRGPREGCEDSVCKPFCLDPVTRRDPEKYKLCLEDCFNNNSEAIANCCSATCKSLPGDAKLECEKACETRLF